mgnify:CR=1 FL=1
MSNKQLDVRLLQLAPPEEDPFAQIYNEMEFIDDVSGEPLERDEAIKARKMDDGPVIGIT